MIVDQFVTLTKAVHSITFIASITGTVKAPFSVSTVGIWITCINNTQAFIDIYWIRSHSTHIDCPCIVLYRWYFLILYVAIVICHVVGIGAICG